jgi:hypothetical protein
MTQRINFYGAKGGVGTTTLAVVTAALLSKGEYPAPSVGIFGQDEDSILAISGTTGGFINPLCHVNGKFPDDGHYADIEVHDLGVITSEPLAEGINVLVLRNDYLSLRATHFKVNTDADPTPFDLAVTFVLPEAALGIREVTDVLTCVKSKGLTVEVTPAIARANDAGVLLQKTPESLSKAAQHIATLVELASLAH